MKLSWLLLAITPTLCAEAGDLCEDPITTVEINQCGQSAFLAADKKMNVAFQAALHRVSSDLQNKQQQDEIRRELIDAQRLWVEFRDKDCGAIYDLWRYGAKAEIRDSMYQSCLFERTEQRTQELEDFGLQG